MRMDGSSLTNLSAFSHKPCILLKFPTCTILFDSVVDFSSMNFYAPSSVIPKCDVELTDYGQTENALDAICGTHPILRKYPDNTAESNDFFQIVSGKELVDTIPEVNFVFASNIDLSVIDAMFISHWESLKGLPYLTDKPEFSCPIYAAEPVTALGGMIIEELIHFIERVDKPKDDKQWVDLKVWDFVVGEDSHRSVPSQWCPMYSKESLQKALSRINRISINQSVKVGNNVNVSLYPSGFDIGSCNWLINIGNQRKVGYWTASSLIDDYMHEMDLTAFKKLDCLILTSLRMVQANLNDTIDKMCRNVIDTLRADGNVLFPVEPIGPLYGLIENLIGALDRAMSNTKYHVYIVSPVASRALAWTNIEGEWFNKQRREGLFEPKLPFYIAEFIDRKRVFLYDSIHSAFSSEYTTPCVVFAGHPSLRIGDAVFFLELWGNSSKNSVMLTHPDYDFESVWAPYNHLKIRPYFYPVDRRLSVDDVNSVLGTAVCADKLIVPEDYTVVDPKIFKHSDVEPIKVSYETELVTIDNVMQLNCFSEEIVQKAAEGCGIVQGYLTHTGTNVELMTVEEVKNADAVALMNFRGSAADMGGMIKAEIPFRSRLIGEIDCYRLQKAFETEKHQVRSTRTGQTTVLKVRDLAEITVHGNQTRIKCVHAKDRRYVAGMIQKCLRNAIPEK